MRWILGVLVVLALAGVATAEEILLNDGSGVEGEIQTVDQNGIQAVADGKTVEFAPADLDVHYYYDAWAKRVQNDAEGHLRLAVFAYKNGMFNQARSQYRKAERLDKDLVKHFETDIVPQIKEGIADHLLDLARKAIKDEDWDKAKRIASKILTQLEDTKAADQAREALASIHLWQLGKDEERLVRSLAQYLPKDEEKALQVQEKVAKKLDPIQRRIQSAQDLVTKGLRTKSANRQKDVFKQAAKRFDQIVSDLDKLAAESAGDDALVAHIGEMRKTAVRDGVDAYADAGQVYLVRRAYQDAMRMANAALVLDPDSAHAKQFQQQTIRGSQMRNGWWGRGR